jgi:hypothetical protein
MDGLIVNRSGWRSRRLVLSRCGQTLEAHEYEAKTAALERMVGWLAFDF